MSPVLAEPLFDNNGFTIRDKIRTFAVGFGERRQTYKRLGDDSATLSIEAQCWDVGYTYGSKESESPYFSLSYCPEPGLEDGAVNEDRSASFISVGYLYAVPQSRGEAFGEWTFVDYPAVPGVGPFDESSLSFGGYELNVGFAVDIVDGQRFSITAGTEVEIYSRYEVDDSKSNIQKSKKFSAYLRSSYLIGDSWAAVIRIGGTGREGAALSIMRSF